MEQISTVSQFHERLKKLGVEKRPFLYRGQSDSDWPVDCSAARRLTESGSHPIEDQLVEQLLVGYLEYLIGKARRFDESAADLELMARLQHQGAATGLIDFTRDPLVALWFACNEFGGKDGAVYALPYSKAMEISQDDLKKKIQSFYDERKRWSWEPPMLDNRIKAQRSVFVFGVRNIPLPLMEKITIPAASKSSILRELEAVYGINEEKLFPDFSGYAVANSSKKAFDVNRATDYWEKQVASASSKEEKVIAHFRCGVACSAIQEHEEAIGHYDEGINNLQRGIAKGKLDQRYDEAIHIDLQLATLAEAYNNRGHARAGLGQYEEAIADYNEAICLNPHDATAYNNRGNAKAALGQYGEAIANYDQALRIDRHLAMAYNNRGNAKVELGQYGEAIADYDQALRIDPQYAVAYNSRGYAKNVLRRHEEAISDYDEVIRIDPQFVTAYKNRGIARATLGQYREAVSDYNEAIRINPHDAAAYSNRGNAKAALGQYGEAIADYNETIRINPHDAAAYSNRGNAKALLGQHGEAIADYNEAIRINPRDAMAYNNRGNAKAALGQHGEAIADYDQAYALIRNTS